MGCIDLVLMCDAGDACMMGTSHRCPWTLHRPCHPAPLPALPGASRGPAQGETLAWVARCISQMASHPSVPSTSLTCGVTHCIQTQSRSDHTGTLKLKHESIAFLMGSSESEHTQELVTCCCYPSSQRDTLQDRACSMTQT